MSNINIKKQKREYKTKETKGITLVALVITVIILIILAGITIAGLTGEKGLIREAKTAKELTELASLEEQIELAIIKAEQKHRNPTIDDVIEEIKNNKVISNENQVNKETGAVHTDAGYLIEGKLNDYIGKISIGDENTTGNNTTEGNNTGDGNTSGGGDTPTPPTVNEIEPGEIVTGDENKTYTKNGTAVIPVGFAIVPGLDDVEEGLVISDVANDTANIGNQFVWIPVTDEIPYERNTSYEVSDISKIAHNDTDYLPEGITDEEEAVRRAKGFYISRYEAGKKGTGTLVSKKGATVWMYITQENAKETAKTMYTSNTHVKSALISGIQWDMTMAFISSKPRVDGTNKTYDVTKTDSARHKSVIKPEMAGNNEADKVCNIYDLEGNTFEYVAEKKTNGFGFIYRGGTFNDSTYSASSRRADTGEAYSNFSFRLVLYVQ